MKYHVPAILVFALLAGSNRIVSAQSQYNTPMPPTAAKPSGNTDSPMLKEVQFHGQNLSEAVESLRKTCPHFQAVVVGDEQHPASEVRLPDIDLKNIDLNQLIEVLKQTVPQLTIDRVAGDSGTVYLFRVSPQGAGGGAMGGGLSFTSPAMAMAANPNAPGVASGVQTATGYTSAAVGAVPSAPPQPSVQIYRLGPLLPAAGEADRKKALNDILALVQAALEAQGSANQALMKVHEATETLIFRGNQEQLEVVQIALKALVPTSVESERTKLRDQLVAERGRIQDKIEQLEMRLKEAGAEAADARKRISEQATEIEVLKSRLAAKSEKSQ
jgi:hypothetical protein